MTFITVTEHKSKTRASLPSNWHNDISEQLHYLHFGNFSKWYKFSDWLASLTQRHNITEFEQQPQTSPGEDCASTTAKRRQSSLTLPKRHESRCESLIKLYAKPHITLSVKFTSSAFDFHLEFHEIIQTLYSTKTVWRYCSQDHERLPK